MLESSLLTIYCTRGTAYVIFIHFFSQLEVNFIKKNNLILPFSIGGIFFYYAIQLQESRRI